MPTRRLELPLIIPDGAECVRCMERLEREVGAARGIVSAGVDRESSTLSLEYDEDQVALDALERKVTEIGAAITERFRHETLILGGLDCPDCAATLDHVVSRIPGVVHSSTSVVGSNMRVEYRADEVALDAIVSKVRSMGYEAQPESVSRARRARELPARPRLREGLTAACGAMLVAGLICAAAGGPAAVCRGLYAAAILVGGYFVARGALAALRGLAVDMNVLMTLAVVGAAIIGEWEEAAAVVVLFSLGNALESHVMRRTRRAIGALLDLAPAQAVVRRDGEEVVVAAEELVPGDVIVIRPGERIVTDGTVVSGSSPVDQAPLTGESLAVSKGAGDPVYAGSVNGLGALIVRVTRTMRDNTLASIIELVETAQSKRAPYQRAVDRFARYYTPVVVLGALAIALAPPAVTGDPFGPWVYRGLALLILACPCALVISTPVAVVSAINTATRSGVLVKGGAYLEALGRTRAMAFDKTGTLTSGRPQVTDVAAAPGATPAEVMALAAAVEARSEHPLGRAIVTRAHRDQIGFEAGANFTALAGAGATAEVNGAPAYAGSPALFVSNGADLSGIENAVPRLEGEGKTVILVGGADRALGVIGIADVARQGAAEALANLRQLGMGPLVMLTGDNQGTAKAIGDQLGLDDYHAGLLPADKVDAVTQLAERYGSVIVVGDGVNDAPALAASTVGIAMGATGSDAALENADVALMGDDLGRLPFVVRLGRATLANIRQNVALSLTVKLALLALAVPGVLTLWLAVLGDVGVSLVVIANGMRLLAARP
ncbi:MAG: cadmium-translocating P-type ATPase [Armatimonadota bacterium]|nr:MAG: cadmium-translocating P-type ATPase [Armatimonadota bacterium]